MMVMVIKRNNKTEKFNSSKIVKVLKATGLSTVDAKKVSKNVEEYLTSRKKTKITSLQIRDRVLLELKKVNIYSANLYEWYEKVKDKESSENNGG